MSITPYVGGDFKHDIFVSYSHGTGTEDGRESDIAKWTRALIRRLKEHVGLSVEHERVPVNVWYDGKLAGNEPLTDTLKKRVTSSATLLIVMSRPYLSSVWCEHERDWFEAEIKRRGGGIRNVFVVRAMPTEGEDWPQFLKDDFGETVLGFRFCDAAKKREARPYGWVDPDNSATQSSFHEALTKLTAELAATLDQLRAKHCPPPAPTSAPVVRQANRWPIFVAPGTEDVQQCASEARTLLNGRGCMVLPPEEGRIEELADEHQHLEVAKAFVQFIGATPARCNGEAVGRVQKLYESAQERGLQPFVWRNESIPLEALGYDEAFKAFVQGLGETHRATTGELVDAVIEFLTELDAGSDDGRQLVAFIEVPVEAWEDFGQLRSEIEVDDCLLLPMTAPGREQIDQIKKHRNTRQLIYEDCQVVLILYVVPARINWLKDAIVDFLRDSTKARRSSKGTPSAVVVDYVGEAEAHDLAVMLGVDYILWGKDKDASDLWHEVREIVA